MRGLINRFVVRLRALFRQRHNDAIGEELCLHRQMLEDEYRGQGMSREDAHAAARRQFGNMTQIQEQCHDLFAFTFLEDLARDIRLAMRSLRKRPSVSTVVVLTLAVAIGAATVIFSTIDAIWNILPIEERDRLVFVSSTDVRLAQAQAGISGGLARVGASLPDFVDWSDETTSFEGLAAFRFDTATLTGVDLPIQISTVCATANLLSLWGVNARFGRGFMLNESLPGAARVVILTHRFWQSQFSSDIGVLGQSVLLNGEAHTVIGVLPPETGTGIFKQIDAFVPLTIDAARAQRDERRLFVTARLKSGVTRGRAESELAAVTQRLQVQYPLTNAQIGTVVRPLIELVGGNIPFLLSLFALIAFLMIAIACANVANVMLAQGTTRIREMAMRAALGASRSRQIRQLMVEALFLAGLAGVAGVVIGSCGIATIKRVAGGEALGFSEMALNARVLAVALLTSFVVPIGFALLPAFRSSARDAEALRESTRSQSTSVGSRGRQLLVAVQVGLAMVLMVQSSLFANTAWKFRTLQPGFDPTDVLTFRVDLPPAKYSDRTRIEQFYSQLLSEVSAITGVTSAAAISQLPIADTGTSVRFSIEGAPSVPTAMKPFGSLVGITPDYLRTMRIPVIRGHAFTAAEQADTPAVALVNEVLANRYWHGDAVGQRIAVDSPTTPVGWMEIVGVVGDVRNSDVDQDLPPQVYTPSSWQPQQAMAIVVRASGRNPLQLVPAIRARVMRIDRELPIFRVASMEEVIASDTAGTYLLALILTMVALVALCLAASGTYGVVAYAVRQRTAEIGIRMALGAQPGAVLQMIFGQAAIPVMSGTLTGVAAALGLAHVTASLAELGFGDPIVHGGVVLLVVIVTTLATYLPARYAARVNPNVALRHE